MSQLMEPSLMKTNVFIQSEFLDTVEVIEVEQGIGHAELTALVIERVGRGEEELFVFIEDVDSEHALRDLGKVGESLSLHVHRRKEITAVVRYAGRHIRRVFRPAATVGRIKDWAVAEFGITASDGAELMLQIAGTDQRPDVDIHLGALPHEHHEVTFDLVPSPRVNG